MPTLTSKWMKADALAILHIFNMIPIIKLIIIKLIIVHPLVPEPINSEGMEKAEYIAKLTEINKGKSCSVQVLQQNT